MHHASEHRKKGVLNHPAGTLIWQSANHSDQIGFNKGAIQKRKKKIWKFPNLDWFFPKLLRMMPEAKKNRVRPWFGNYTDYTIQLWHSCASRNWIESGLVCELSPPEQWKLNCSPLSGQLNRLQFAQPPVSELCVIEHCLVSLGISNFSALFTRPGCPKIWLLYGSVWN